MNDLRSVHRPAITFDMLWALAILTLIGCFITLVPTPPNDFWWHLRAGQLVAHSGIPRTNLFGWTLPPDTPYVYATWLGEWLFYQLSVLGGLQAVAVARNLLGLAGFALVAVDARRRSGSWRLAALAMLRAGLLTINNLIIRTQNWSWVPFGLFLVLLSAYAAGTLQARWLAVLPPVMAFWVNAHGAFVLGLVMLAIYVAGESVRMLLGRPAAPSPRRVLWLYLTLAACLAATALNPLGIGIFGYVAKLLTDPPSQNLINEWQPATTRTLAGQFFFLGVLALVAALGLARRRPTITDILLICAFLWEAFTGQRYVVWFGMVAMPILVQSCAAVQPQPRPAGVPLANALLAAVLVACLVVCQPPLRNRLPFPPAYTSMFAPVPDAPLTFSNSTPVAATEWLRAHQPGEGRLFNEMGYGSYLIWALWPETQVFIDPRVELYPLAQWQDYQAASDGREVRAIMDRYGITRVMLNRQNQAQLSAVLAADPAWTREYQDAGTEIYRRRQAP